MQGASQKWYESQQGTIINWGEFKYRFIVGFPCIDDTHELRMLFMKRLKQKAENMEDNFYDMTAMADKAKLSLDETIKYIIAGLNDPNLINVLDAIKPKSLPELLLEIKNKECNELYRQSRQEINLQGKNLYESKSFNNFVTAQSRQPFTQNSNHNFKVNSFTNKLNQPNNYRNNSYQDNCINSIRNS